MTCELWKIHMIDQRADYSHGEALATVGEGLALHQSLIKRGWVWKMPAKYHVFARDWLKFGMLEDGDYEENGMKPKIRIVLNYGLVSAITSEGSAIAVEIIEEDTGLEEHFTSNSKGGASILYLPEPPLEGTVTQQ